MKYAILINQKAVVDAGLILETDLMDWAILGYIQDSMLLPTRQISNGHVWLSYHDLMTQIPLLQFKTKQVILKRIIKLEQLKLISVFESQDRKIFVALTNLYIQSIICCDNKVSTIVDINTNTFAVNNTGDNYDKQRVNYDRQLAVDKTKLAVNQPIRLGKQAAFEWSQTHPFWSGRITSMQLFLTHWGGQHKKSSFRSQWEQHKKELIEYRTGKFNNEKYQSTHVEDRHKSVLFNNLTEAQKIIHRCGMSIEGINVID